MKKCFSFFSSVALALTVFMLPFGAYVRLKSAGMACPDWPLCYDKVIPPNLPGVVYEVGHRYVAALLILAVFFLLIIAIKNANFRKNRRILLAVCLIITLQALLGALTIWLALSPAVVTMHLLFGHATLALIFWNFLLDQSSVVFQKTSVASQKSHLNWWQASLINNHQPIKHLFWLIFIYISLLILGGMNAATLSGYSCFSFPLCSPLLESYNSGFALDWQNYLQLWHRLFALIFWCFALVLWLRYKSRLCAVLFFLTTAQFLVGIMNAMHSIPLAISTLHSFLAALLTLSITFFVYKFAYKQTQNL